MKEARHAIFSGASVASFDSNFYSNICHSCVTLLGESMLGQVERDMRTQATFGSV